MAPRIGYLGPEIPALSATFIYEELLGLRRRGLDVRAYSIRAPVHPAAAQRELQLETRVLYRRPAPLQIAAALLTLPIFGRRVGAAMRLLRGDMASVGLKRMAAWKLAYQWLMGALLGRMLTRDGITHLHVHFAHTPTQIAMYASAFTGIPFTVTAHANDIFERPLLLAQKVQRARRLLTISYFNLTHLRSLGIAAERLAVVRCGVSFAPRADVPRFERRARYRVGTLCRLVEKKGVDDLLRAVAALRDAPFAIELSIGGDGPLLGTLQALAQSLRIADRVTFEGAIDHASVTPWLHSLDVFALACKKDSNGDMDGIPVVLMEAMSQRVPVLSTVLTGIPELVIHERTGLLAAPADPAALAVELRRLLEDAGLRARLSAAAVDHVRTEFGQSVNLDRLMKHFGSPAHAPASPERRAHTLTS